MKTLIKRFQAWRRRRYLDRVARWERTREKGKARFVIRGTLIWSGAMIVFTSLYDYYSYDAIEISNIIYFTIAGPIVGLVSWWSNEGEFRAAKIDARMREMRQQVSLDKGDV
jgi:hypothetical protein